MASRTLAGLALFALTAIPLGAAAPAVAQGTMSPPTPAPVAAGTPAALPSPISSLPPASQPVTLPYPAYGTPVPGVNRGVPSAGVPQVVSLDQAVAIGFARSPVLASARATIEIDTAPVDLAKTAYLPSLSGSASTTHYYAQNEGNVASAISNGTRTTGLSSYVVNQFNGTLSELIYDGGKVAAELREAKATQNGAFSTYKRQLQTVAYNVANAYYAALAAQRNTQVANETLKVDQVNADLVAAQIAAGTAARSDLLTAELPVAQARVALVQDQGLELSQQAAFVNAMGLDANTHVLPQDDGNVLAGSSGAPKVAVPTYQIAITRAYMLRPDFTTSQFGIASAQAAVKAAKLGLFPNLNGNGTYGTTSISPTGGNFRNAGQIGLDLTIPIYDKGVTHAQVVQAEGQLDAAVAALESAREGIQLNVKQTLVSLVSAGAAFTQTQAELDNAREVLQSTQAQYAAGVTTLPLLLNAEVGLTTALAAQVNAVYTLRQAEAAFLYAEGATLRREVDPMTSTLPVWIDDPVNAAILAVSEDRLAGFQLDPFGEIAERADLPVATVLERIGAMLDAGTIRRVRQTLMATNLAAGALVAWQVPNERLTEAFEYLFREDPFSGHCVIRTTDAATPGSNYRLWTTLKVPQGFSIEKHAQHLAGVIGAEHFRLMPAKCLFALGVGHVRRRGLAPGARAAEPAKPTNTEIVELDALEWRVLTAIKRELARDEIVRDVWAPRAREAGVSPAEFERIGAALNARGVIGRFSTFLEHVKPNEAGERVTRYNGLFHWAVPPGRELAAGGEVGRHYCMTHAYWREGGPEFRNVNVMGVLHGTEKDTVLAHKAAIDEHLREAGIDFSYTNVFWGGRSEIKPSEISPLAYVEYCNAHGLDPDAQRTAQR